jgi:hypothetical protein
MTKHSDPPLGLPKGSVRAILTFVLVAITAAVLFVPISEGSAEVRSMFVLLTGIAVRDYFSTRAETDRAKAGGQELASGGDAVVS